MKKHLYCLSSLFTAGESLPCNARGCPLNEQRLPQGRHSLPQLHLGVGLDSRSHCITGELCYYCLPFTSTPFL